MGANEAQHVTALKSVGAGRLVPNPSLPKSLTAAEVTVAVVPGA